MDFGTIIAWVIIIFLVVCGIGGSIFTVEQQTVRIVERFGKFLKMGRPGLNFKLPLIDSVSRPFDMKLQQLTVASETKTKDNVFVRIDVAIQYEPIPEKVYEAYYRLQNPGNQITSYVYDSVRSQVPELTLDDVFLQKNTIADSIEKALEEHMTEFGYSVVKVLVIDVVPDKQVQDAMNEIQAATRLAQAAQQKGEAAKTLVVKNAEAEAESKKLQGEGIANQRKAIIEGLKESIASMAEAVGVDSKEVMNLVLLTQYFDTMKEVGTGSGSKVVFLPSSPGGMRNFADEIRTAIMSANDK